MKLRKLEIVGFRSVKSKQTVFMDGRITVLIGANDHGKTNVLEAISYLNESTVITDRDRNWDLLDNEEPIIEWVFEVDSREGKKLKQFITSDPIPAAEQSYIPQDARGLVIQRKGVGAPLHVVGSPMQVPATAEAEILLMRPKVEIFNESATTLADSTSTEALEGDLVMQGIFRLAGLWDERASLFEQTPVNTKRLDKASEQLSKTLNDKWNQGKNLEWKLRHNASSIDVLIGDPSIANRYSRPSLRSAGFRTYFLLSMMTLAKTDSDPAGSYIFLFDEPGTYLHPHAQIDLQRSFERIADTSQIVYTTHSMFLVSKNNPGRNKVIVKTKNGSEIDQKPFIRNWKSLRDSLGILFNSNFLIADKTLLVEGPSDIVYILQTIKSLTKSGHADIDLNDLSIVDAGNSENYVAMAKLMLSEGRSIVALLDGDKPGKEMESRLKKVCAEEINSKLLAIEILPNEKSVEDVFVDLAVFQEAAASTAKDIVHSGARVLSSNGTDLVKASKQIQAKVGSTLGRAYDIETATWFEPNEKLSKLSTALKYEQIIADSTVDPVPTPEALALIKRLQTVLKVRGVKSVEEGVFDPLR